MYPLHHKQRLATAHQLDPVHLTAAFAVLFCTGLKAEQYNASAVESLSVHWKGSPVQWNPASVQWKASPVHWKDQLRALESWSSHEVLEKKAVEQGDISFYELAALDVCVQQAGTSVEVELQNFFVPPDDVPEDVRQAITHWSQWIDYWAVDWDYRDDTFHNQWQTYRSRKSPKIVLKALHQYDEPGKYIIVIKVIDILGNDTTKAVVVAME